jgi:dTDP-glucose 4,6-dehydratase
MMEKLLVTGGAGFIGSNFVRRFHKDYDIRVLDCLTYAGRMENLEGVLDNIEFMKGDISDPRAASEAMKGVSGVIHFAAESHVDNSIERPSVFINTNVVGTHVLLEAARVAGVKRFVYISTDEVYGSVDKGLSRETDNLNPSSPYSATKAAGELLAMAYWRTFGLPVTITRSSNNFGPYQFPEKLIPVLIRNAMRDKALPIYGDGKNVRDWLFVLDNCEGIETVFRKGVPGEAYNLGGSNEKSNLEIVREILSILGKPESLISFVKDRPGHDRRYALDSSKANRLGWKCGADFRRALERTVEWYSANPRFLG